MPLKTLQLFNLLNYLKLSLIEKAKLESQDLKKLEPVVFLNSNRGHFHWLLRQINAITSLPTTFFLAHCYKCAQSLNV